MAVVNIQVIKGNGNEEISWNQTEKGNYSITGTIYDCENVTVKQRVDGRVQKVDISDRFMGIQCTLIMNRTQLEEILVECEEYYKNMGTDPRIGLIVEVSKVPMPVEGRDPNTNQKSLNTLIRSFNLIGVEEPEEILDESLGEYLDEAFQITSNKNKVAKQKSLAQRLQAAGAALTRKKVRS